MNILATINQFWRGGRETFLLVLAEALERGGHSVEILAGQMDTSVNLPPGWNGLSEFPYEEWEGYRPGKRPGVIWAHHSGLWKAWQLSRVLGAPMHTTFHSPLRAGEPLCPEEALGITLALHRAEGVSAVSEEVADSIGALHSNGKPIPIFRNAVVFPYEKPTPPSRTSVLLATRSEKINHIRAGILLFARGWKTMRWERMNLVIAFPPQAGLQASSNVSLLRLLGRKWVLKNVGSLFPIWHRLKLRDPCDDLAPHIGDSSVVFGMGRVILEGLARGRAAVLVGYDQPIDVVNRHNFRLLAGSNFSGRRCLARPASEIIARLDGWLPPEQHDLLAYSPDRCRRIIERVFAELPPPSPHNRLSAKANNTPAREPMTVEAALNDFACDERQTYQRLIRKG